MLMHHGDALRERVRRAPRLEGRAAKRMTPESGRCTPKIRLQSVDLPAPFSPRRQWISPGADVERDIRQRGKAAEPLRDRLQRQKRFGGGLAQRRTSGS